MADDAFVYELTEIENAKLPDMKNELSSSDYHAHIEADNRLLLFLRHYGLDVEIAVHHYKEHLRWLNVDKPFKKNVCSFFHSILFSTKV